jgi:hypothetical protein
MGKFLRTASIPCQVTCQLPAGNSMGQLPSYLRPAYSLVQSDQLASNCCVPLRHGLYDRLP